jgi:hypothetical protein
MKRGWILFYSVVVVVLVAIGPIFGTIILAHYFKGLAAAPYTKIFIVFGSVIAASLVSLIVVYYKWAPNNLFFTFVPEGRAKAAVRGDAFQKILIQWEGYSLSKAKSNDGTVDIGDVIEATSHKRIFGGLRFYGIWPFDDIYLYNFGWTDILENGKSQPHPERLVDYIVLKTTLYYVKLESAEDNQKMPLDVELILKVRITNPYKALFRVQNWLEILINITETAVRNIITRKSYNQWIEEKEDLGNVILKELTENGLIKEFKDNCGVSLLVLGVKDINPSGDLRGITLKKVTAEKQREAIEVEADAERIRIGTVYKAVQDYGDLGKSIRYAEAVEKSSGNGAKWILGAPNLVQPDSSSILISEKLDELKKSIAGKEGKTQEGKAKKGKAKKDDTL